MMTRLPPLLGIFIAACSAPPIAAPPDPMTSANASAPDPVPTPPESEAWHLEIVDYDPTGAGLQLLPSKAGTPRMVFASGGESMMLLATRDAGGAWTAEELAYAGVIDPNVYVEGSGGRFVLSPRSKAGLLSHPVGAKAKPTVLDAAAEQTWSLDAALVEGRAPHVCWTAAKGSKPMGAKHATLTDAGWIVKPIPIPDAALCAVAAAADGSATIAINTEKDRVFVVHVDAQGALSAPVEVGEGRWPGLAVDAKGELVVALSREDGFFLARSARPITGALPFDKISDRPGYHPSIGIDESGRLRIARILYGDDEAIDDLAVVESSSAGGAGPWSVHELGRSTSRRAVIDVQGERASVAFLPEGEGGFSSVAVLATNRPLDCRGPWCAVPAEARFAASTCAANLATPAAGSALQARAVRHCAAAQPHGALLEAPLSARCTDADVGACTLLGLFVAGRKAVVYDELKLLEPRKCPPKKTCKRVYHVSVDAKQPGFSGMAADPKRAREVFGRACSAGGAFACEALAFLEEADAPADALAHATEACARGRASACAAGMKLAQGMDKLASSTELLRAAHATLTLACQSEDGPSCVNLGFLLEHGLGAKKELAKAAAAYRLACEIDEADAHGCERLVALKSKAAAAVTGVSWEEVTMVLEDACADDDDPNLCLAFADAVEAGIGAKRDAARAKTIRDRACTEHRGLCAD